MKFALAMAAIATIAAAMMTDSAHSAARVERGECDIEIEGRSYNSAPCVVTRSWNEIEFTWQGEGELVHKGLIMMGGPRIVGLWNGDDAKSSIETALGVLEQDGDCWRGAESRATICLNVDGGGFKAGAPTAAEALLNEQGELLTPLFGVSAAHCETLPDWMRAGSRFEQQGYFAEEKHAFVEERLVALNLDLGYRGARELTRQVWACYIESYIDGDELPLENTLRLVGGYRTQFERHPMFEEALQLWRQDFLDLAKTAEAIDENDRRLEPLFKVFSMIGNQWQFLPSELADSSERTAFGKAVNEKRQAHQDRANAQRQADQKAALANYLDAAMARYGAQVDRMGWRTDVLDASIVIEGVFGNTRWLTLREWVAALYHSGQFESIEYSDLAGYNASGVITKRAAQRSRSWYFQKEGSELYLTYAGEGGDIYVLQAQERARLSPYMQSMIGR